MARDIHDMKPGDQFRLLDHHGYKPDYDPTDELEALKRQVGLSMHHPLFADQVGTVYEPFVPADVSGAGPDTEDCIVLQFDHREWLSHDGGPDGGVEHQLLIKDARLVSFTQEQMDSLFEEVK
jgi:hypothetical protein